MEPAFIIINNKLLETGMSQEEVDMLMGRFLQEEAQEYIDCINLVKEHIQSKEGVILH